MKLIVREENGDRVFSGKGKVTMTITYDGHRCEFVMETHSEGERLLINMPDTYSISMSDYEENEYE